jgi:multiple antibiotic resistance protein
LVLVIVFSIVFGVLFLLTEFRNSIEKKKFKTVFDKNMEFLLRLNEFFIGAIGVNMIIEGAINVFF